MNTDDRTAQQLDAMSRVELLAFYNRLNPTAKLKAFRTLSDGRIRVTASLQLRSTPAAAVRVASARAGRPAKAFSVQLLPDAPSTPQKRSLRGKILEHLRASGPEPLPIDALLSQFGSAARGAVQKLVAARWLRKVVV